MLLQFIKTVTMLMTITTKSLDTSNRTYFDTQVSFDVRPTVLSPEAQKVLQFFSYIFHVTYEISQIFMNWKPYNNGHSSTMLERLETVDSLATLIAIVFLSRNVIIE